MKISQFSFTLMLIFPAVTYCMEGEPKVELAPLLVVPTTHQAPKDHVMIDILESDRVKKSAEAAILRMIQAKDMAKVKAEAAILKNIQEKEKAQAKAIEEQTIEKYKQNLFAELKKIYRDDSIKKWLLEHYPMLNSNKVILLQEVHKEKIARMDSKEKELRSIFQQENPHINKQTFEDSTIDRCSFLDSQRDKMSDLGPCAPLCCYPCLCYKNYDLCCCYDEWTEEEPRCNYCL